MAQNIVIQHVTYHLRKYQYRVAGVPESWSPVLIDLSCYGMGGDAHNTVI